MASAPSPTVYNRRFGSASRKASRVNRTSPGLSSTKRICIGRRVSIFSHDLGPYVFSLLKGPNPFKGAPILGPIGPNSFLFGGAFVGGLILLILGPDLRRDVTQCSPAVAKPIL